MSFRTYPTSILVAVALLVTWTALTKGWNSLTPLDQKEELTCMGGSGPFQICPVAPNGTCPGCTPPMSCTIAAGGACVMAGGAAGCSAPWGSFSCVFATALWCNDFTFPAWCGVPQTPSCPPAVIIGGVPTCPSGGCAAGGASSCNSC